MIYEHDPPQQRIVEKFYNGSSVVVSSSIAEGFALPPAEGAACGCAIAATDSGGIRDFAEHGVTALLSPPKDPEALGRNICVILGNDDLRIRLARSANDLIKQFTWERSTDLMEDFVINAVTRKTIARSSASAVEVSPA
jgi:glycosyltransferase involved in cell wall biosynthesis